jgi:hypothetical protein
MKQYSIILLFVFFFGFSAFSQKYDKELLKSYSQKELEGFDYETIKALEYGLENAIYYTEISSSKDIVLSEINIPENAKKFTDLNLKISSENQYLRVKGSNKMMVVKSLYVLKNELATKN